MSRTLVISDIHGCIHEFNDLLDLINYTPADDKLILLGDYGDRGKNTREVIDKAIQLVSKGATALRGNHDHMFLDALNGRDDYLFLFNGGIETIESYVGLNWFENFNGFEYSRYLEAKEFIKNHYANYISFLESLPYHCEDDNHIYVHAGLDPSYDDNNWTRQSTENFIWIRDMFLKIKPLVSKTIVFGHTPTVNMQDTADIWYGEGKIGIDGGCVFGYQLNCLEIVNSSQYNKYSISRRK